MAVEVLFTIAGGILKTLAPLITDEIVLLWGFHDELQNLERTVTTIQAVLLDAEARRATSNAVSIWLGQLNDILYEADDLLDAISTEVQLGKITRDKNAKKVCTFSPILKHPTHVLKMGHSLREIKVKIDAIAADISRFQFLVRPEEGVRGWGRGDTYSDLGVESIIGRDNDKKAVIDRLMASNVKSNVSIVPIVGIGGLGKTTLAKLIFNDPQIQETFELKMWICVSEPFDVKVIVKQILKFVKEKFHDNDPMDELVKNLRKGIEGKKYLLVLDDVWCEVSSHWSELNKLLMYGGRGSRILVTTRKLAVANILRTKPHKLDGLGEDDSWVLFKREAFVNENESESFEGMGREILKKCKGVPLAVKTVGRLLYSKGLKRWQKFIKDELSKIPQEEEDIIPTLKLSYDELPLYLKHCFGFCSLFPKDYEFKVTTLINHWMAQGFINSQENKCLEDIGYDYFMNLLWRSFFQEVQMDESGNIIGCKMHDLMHDLATLVSGSFIVTFPIQDSINYQKIRHVAVTPYETIDSVMLRSLYEARMIRTFFCPWFFTHDNNLNYVEVEYRDIIKHFKFLRTLDLSGNKLHDVPKSIGKLMHLRFLDLSYNRGIMTLPSSITKLVNLQSLRLRECRSLIKLPRDFKKLVNLRFLDIHGCEFWYLPRGFGQLIKLRHLDASYCSQLRCLPHGIGKLMELQILNLKCCDSLQELPKDIEKLVNLRFIETKGCTKLRCLPRGFGHLANLKGMPSFMVDLSSTYKDNGGLEELSGLNDFGGELIIRGLSCGKGRQYEVANLKGKQKLDSLLLEWSNNGVVTDFDDDASWEGLQPHRSLKRLKLVSCRCPRHPRWLSLLTSLVNLSLNGCSKWQCLPPLDHLLSLQSLELHNMNDLEYISNYGEGCDFSMSLSSPFSPSLKEMKLKKCPNLKGWWGGSPTKAESLLIPFPLLSKLEIENCPVLTSMPMFPHLEEPLFPLLRWRNGWKLLEQTLVLAVSLCTPLSKLENIEFESVIDLEALPEAGLQGLAFLKILRFKSCDKLKSLSPGVQHLATVQELFIKHCPIFVDEEDGMQWQGLRNLHLLHFENLPKLSSLPLGLQHVTTLKKLKILNCESLMAIPEWIHQCKLLKELYVYGCSNLASLPVETCEPWSLRRLVIWKCLILSKKCETEKGEYWPKISHIQQLQVEPPESKSVLRRMCYEFGFMEPDEPWGIFE